MKRDVYQETWKKIKHHLDERTESKNAGPLTARFPSAVILKNDCRSFLLEIVPGAFDCYLLAGHSEISVFLEDFLQAHWGEIAARLEDLLRPLRDRSEKSEGPLRGRDAESHGRLHCPGCS